MTPRPQPMEVNPLLPWHSPPGTRGARAVRLSVLVPVYNERHLVAASLSRVLALADPAIASLEVVVVDDCSTDGSWEVLQQFAAPDSGVTLVRHERNLGKGAAVRTALAHATGEVVVVHDADLEYNPADIPALLRPFIEEGADAVFGSRYMAAPYRRAQMHRHTVINKALTWMSNWLTDLSLSDLETCYKAVNTALLKSIPLRSNDFRFEVEIAFKLAKRRARVFEVPIRYTPRSYEEGKKIRARDGVLALGAMVRHSLIDDAYAEDEHGSHLLATVHGARRFSKWMADTLRPFVGDRVLELGAGVGTLTSQFIPRDRYTAADVNPTGLEYLRAYAIGKPYLQIQRIDPEQADDFRFFEERFDTVLLVNVLERVDNDASALANAQRALESGGHVVIVVPQQPKLKNRLDETLGHRKRYTSAQLESLLEGAGFRVDRMFDFYRTAAPLWYLNGTIRGKTRFSRVQLKGLEVAMPIVRRADRFLPWRGLNLVGIATKP